MRVLILWRQHDLAMRKTIIDHTFCFQKYDKENEYFFYNIYNGRHKEDYNWITDEMFDAVIFQCTALGLRWWDNYWDDFLQLMGEVWSNYPAVKILMPQDDYNDTEKIWQFARAIRATKIYTIMPQEDYEIIYPSNKIKGIELETVYTGYVETSNYKEINITEHRKRQYDMVYRATKLPFYFGKHGLLKTDIIDIFNKKIANTKLCVDIQETIGDKGVILGNNWIDFLASSRTTIGCLSGSSIADITGELRSKVDFYMKNHPDDDYDKVKNECFPRLEENLHGMVSPRIFESAATKTCQVLVGKNYQNVLQPDVDYICINEDFSNIDEVLKKITDIEYCEEIADTCYQHIVSSGKYDYKVFVDKIIRYIKGKGKSKRYSEKISNIIAMNCTKNNHDLLKIMENKIRGNV